LFRIQWSNICCKITINARDIDVKIISDEEHPIIFRISLIWGVYRWSFLQTTNEYRSKKLNFEYFLTESVNFVQSSSSKMIKFYLVSELILLGINQKYFKRKKCFSMDNSFTKKCRNHNQIDTMNLCHL
jgi:hypothetical protein